MTKSAAQTIASPIIRKIIVCFFMGTQTSFAFKIAKEASEKRPKRVRVEQICNFVQNDKLQICRTECEFNRLFERECAPARDERVNFLRREQGARGLRNFF